MLGGNDDSRDMAIVEDDAVQQKLSSCELDWHELGHAKRDFTHAREVPNKLEWRSLEDANGSWFCSPVTPNMASRETSAYGELGQHAGITGFWIGPGSGLIRHPMAVGTLSMIPAW
jgi:hypothetical protein